VPPRLRWQPLRRPRWCRWLPGPVRSGARRDLHDHTDDPRRPESSSRRRKSPEPGSGRCTIRARSRSEGAFMKVLALTTEGCSGTHCSPWSTT